jgi:hypothetical protein
MGWAGDNAAQAKPSKARQSAIPVYIEWFHNIAYANSVCGGPNVFPVYGGSGWDAVALAVHAANRS